MSHKMMVIVGAGASREFGLPMGSELKKKIAHNSTFTISEHNLIPSDQFTLEIANRCAQLAGDRTNYRFTRAFSAISEALPLAISIDNFLDVHSNDEKIVKCGKIAIAREIISAERKSTLFEKDGEFRSGEVDQTWIAEFFRVITEGCPLDEISDRLSSVTFVIFNYDRCVEHFLYNALQIYYRISCEHAAAILSRVSFFHPYGSLGRLPWQAGQNNLDFGESAYCDKVINVAAGILTFTESHNVHLSDLGRIKRALAACPTILFLGFAFHKINMRLIFSDIAEKTEKRIFGTAYGISESDREFITQEIKNIFHGEPQLRGDLTCNKIFSEYSRALSWNIE